MKKILVSLLFLAAAVASFAQIDSINYPARKMPFGNWDFIWTNGALTDTVKVYPEKGGIGLDTLFFGDSKQWTAWTPGVSDTGYVKTTGDSIYNNYRIFGGLRVGDSMTLGAVDSNYCIVHGLNSYSYAKWGASFNNSDNNGEYGFSANGGHQFGFRGAAFNDGQNNQEDGFICNLGVNFYTYRQNSFACNKGSNYTSFGFAAGESFCNSWNSATFGYYNDTLPASKVSWVSTDPLFQIGNGTEESKRNDAFRILKNGKTYIGDRSSTTDAILVVDPTDSTSTFIGTVSVEKSVKVGNDTEAASAANVGAIRYRSDSNNSYCEMVMQTGASSYAWVVIKQNTW